MLGVTDTSLKRLDNDLQVFVGAPLKTAQPAKGGEKPFVLQDFISVNALASNNEEQEISSLGRASIVIRVSTAKLKLEDITSSMWIR